MRATLVSKGIESVGAHAQTNVPRFTLELICELNVQRIPLARVCRVCQDLALLQIICGLLPFRVPLHEVCLLRAHEIPLQTGSDRKVP